MNKIHDVEVAKEMQLRKFDWDEWKSYRELNHDEAYEDLYWEIKANEAGNQGFLSQEKSAELLNKIISS